jgi:putative hemolysin
LRIPTSGPTIVVANHPFGAIEGMVLTELLSRVRPDVRTMANYLLGAIPELRDRLILVDPFGGEGAARSNIRPMKEAIEWLRGGGMLAMFPAGEVSSFRIGSGGITDPD